MVGTGRDERTTALTEQRTVPAGVAPRVVPAGSARRPAPADGAAQTALPAWALGRPAWYGALVLAVLSVTARAIRAAITPANPLDLEVYRDAVLAWLGGGPVYNLAFTSATLPFTYPPAGLVTLAWTAAVPFPVAAVLMATASLAALIAVCVLTGRRVGLPPVAVAVAVAVTVWLEPALQTVDFGQVNLLLLLLVVTDALVVPPRWRGLLSGVAAAVKLTPGVFVLYFVVTGQWRAAARQAGGAVAVTLAVVPLTPHSSWRYWTRLVFDGSRAGLPGWPGNQAWTGLSARALGSGAASTASTAVLSLVSLAVAAVAARRLHRAGATVAALGAVGLLGLLVSPISWSHHWVWALPAVLALVGGRRPVVWASGLVLAAVLAAGPQWWFERGDEAYLHWPWWTLIAGDLYPLVGFGCLVVLLVWPAWVGRDSGWSAHQDISSRSASAGSIGP